MGFLFLNVFLFSLLWFFLVGLQNRLVNYKAPAAMLFVVAYITSVVWVDVVRKVVISDSFLLMQAYALGSAAGLVIGKKLHETAFKKYEPLWFSADIFSFYGIISNGESKWTC